MKQTAIRIILVAALIFNLGIAQTYGGGNYGTATYQSNKGTLTYPVKVWGEVTRPGIYDIPVASDFLSVISFAGGPTDMAKLTDVRLIRAKLLEGETETLVIVDIEKYLSNGDKSLLPEIRPGDTIIVGARFMKGITTTMTYIQSIMSIINIIILMQYYTSRTN